VRFADFLSATEQFHAPSKLAFSCVEGMGVGLTATQPISAGETVLSVPAKLWQPWSAEHALAQARQRAPPFVARLEEVARQMGATGAEKLPLHACLALQLLFEQEHPWVQTLPVPDVPALWNERELELLLGTRTHALVQSRRAWQRALHSALFPAGSPVSLPRFSLALASITSRALSDARAPYSFVPVLDALNHSQEASAAHSFDADTQSFQCTALRAHSVGEQLCISYGKHLCNDRALRLYGFTTPGNVHDTALLPPPWPPRRSDEPLAALKARLLLRGDTAPDVRYWWSSALDAEPVAVSGSADAGPLLASLRVIHLVPEDLELEAALDASRPLSARNEAAARASLRDAVLAAMRRYPASLGETEAELESAAEPHALAALRIRAGELRALHGLLDASQLT